MKEYRITEREEGLTLLKYSLRILKEAKQGLVRKFLRNKNIELNGRKADGTERLQAGDSVRFFLSDQTFEQLSSGPVRETEPEKGETLDPKRILYEDADYLFYNKPAGLRTQSDGSGKPSLNSLLLRYVPHDEVCRPSVCNRLDVNTSGIVLCAKSIRGLQTLDSAIRDRRIEKHYLAVCHGRFRQEGRLTAYLKKDRRANRAEVLSEPSERAERIVTEFQVLASSDQASLISAGLITGKPHQIRAHLSFLGHPLYGDGKYGAGRDGCKRQMLHCHENIFPEDILKGMKVRAELPEDLKGLLKKLGLPAKEL